jgi:hypothetical protein
MMHNTFLLDQKPHNFSFDVRELLDSAADGLVDMFDPVTKFFCHRLNRTENGLVREGSSPRYTMMTLLGLHRLERAGIPSKVDIQQVFDNLLQTRDQMNDLGDLGLLLWLCAVVSPENLEKVYATIGISSALSRYVAAQEVRTMELAWFLSGLAHAKLACGEDHQDAARVALETLLLIQGNQGNAGIFGHMARKSFSGLLRGRIGSFADQVYPIYAFSKLSQAYNLPDALQSAINCAGAICGAQGGLGQWWWHYDSVTGKVVEQYPVYSVHQHGMAPMALFALEEACGGDFTPAISKGLNWISGNNELAWDFRDKSADIIWRCAYPETYRRRLSTIATLLTGRSMSPSSMHMKVKFECRPYELGWLLYAFSGRRLAAIS